jgi:hypothetical protein
MLLDAGDGLSPEGSPRAAIPDRGCQLVTNTCLCTVAGSSSSVSMRAGHVGELELLTGFLRRTAEAGRTAAEELAGN